jgi:hypothetical protein
VAVGPLNIPDLRPGTLQVALGFSNKRSAPVPGEKKVTYGSGQEAVEGLHDQAEENSRIRCPHCGNDRPRRVERKTFLEKRILPILGYYPWTCGFCKSSFLARKRNRRKSKRKDYVQE